MLPRSRLFHLVDDKMKSPATDTRRFHSDFRHDDVGAVIASANNTRDGFGRNAATSDNSALGMSSILGDATEDEEVLLRLDQLVVSLSIVYTRWPCGRFVSIVSLAQLAIRVLSGIVSNVVISPRSTAPTSR